MQPENQQLSFNKKKSLQPLIYASNGDTHIDFIQFQDFDKSNVLLYVNNPSQPISTLIQAYYEQTKCKQKIGNIQNLSFKSKKFNKVYENKVPIANLMEGFQLNQIEITLKSQQNEMALMENDQDFYNQLFYRRDSSGKQVTLQIKGYIDNGKGDYKTVQLKLKLLDTDPIGHVKSVIQQQLSINRQRIKIVKNGDPVQNGARVKDLLKLKKDQRVQFFQQFKPRKGDFRLKIKVIEKEGKVFDIVDIKKDDYLIQMFILSKHYLDEHQQAYKMVYRGQVLNLQKRITDYGIQKDQLIQLYPIKAEVPQFKDEKDQVVVKIKISNNNSFKVPWGQLKSKTVKRFFIEFVTGYKHKKPINQNWCLKYGKKILNPNDELKIIEEQIKPHITIETVRNPRYFYFRKMGKSPKIPKEYQKIAKNDDDISSTNKKIKKEIASKNNYTQIERRQFTSQQFLTPINIYTSNFFGEINKKLRNNAIENQQTELSYCITNSLRKIPKLLGKVVHRGQKNYYHGRNNYLQENKLICFSSFTSTSTSLSIAKQFMLMKQIDKFQTTKAKGTMFHIVSLTGRQIKEFSCYTREQEVLFCPYTYFIVDKIIRHPNVDQIWMTEVPSPSFQKSNIVLWIDDDPTGNKKLIQRIQAADQEIEILQVTSTRIANLWMEEFSCLLQFLDINLKVVSDMTRVQQTFGQVDETTRMFKDEPNFNRRAGAQLLRDFNNEHGYTTKILIFCGDTKNATQQITKLNIRDKVWEVTESEDRVFDFCIKQNQMKRQLFTLNTKGWCQIY